MKYLWNILDAETVIEQSDFPFETEREALNDGEEELKEYDRDDLELEIEKVPEYQWQIWLEGNCYGEGVCDTYEEAEEEANEKLEDKIEDWEVDEVWSEKYNKDDFEIIIEEV